MDTNTEERAVITREQAEKERFTLEQIERIGAIIAKSNLFGVKTAEQATALCLIADAEGQHPALAASDYHVIQNTPSLKAKTLLARFQAAGGVVEWAETTDKRAEATFTHPQGGTVTIDWDMDRAKQAGLHLKDNWQKYPRAMLRARVVSEGVPTVFPGASRFYTSEEVRDFDNNWNQGPKDVSDKVEVLPPDNGTDDANEKLEKARKEAADREAAAKKKADADAKKKKAAADKKKKAAADKKKGEKEDAPKETALTKIEHDNQPTGAKLSVAGVAKINSAFDKLGVEEGTLTDWSRLDTEDWTESVRKDLLKLHALVKAGTVTPEQIKEHIAARLAD